MKVTLQKEVIVEVGETILISVGVHTEGLQNEHRYHLVNDVWYYENFRKQKGTYCSINREIHKSCNLTQRTGS